MSTILEAKDLHYNYPDGTEAIRGINFKVEEGQMISILGPNGAGKSTFFLHFNGIIEPTSGEIIIDGKKLEYDKKSLLEVRTKVGIVFQNPDDQLFAPTVFEDVAFGPMNMGLPDIAKAKFIESVVKNMKLINSRFKKGFLNDEIQALDEAMKKYSGLEIGVYNGGQPVYYYYISVE